MSAGIAKWLSLVALVAFQSASALGAETAPLAATPVEVLGTFESAIDDYPAFAVKYRTSQPIQDEAALHSEAARVWQRYFGDAERLGYRRAVFVAVGHAAGTLKEEKASIVFERFEGAWHMVEAVEPTKLDEDYIRAFLARLDWAEQHKATNTFMLFLADDWRRKTKSEVESAKSFPDIGRGEFAEVMRRTFLVTEGYHHKREIVHIAIDPDGRGAQIDSRETNRMVMHLSERESSSVVRVKHYLKIRGSFVLVTKTAYVIEKTNISSAD
jgi:hypothetical protein